MHNSLITMKKMGTMGTIAFILVVVGGLNWGLVGAFGFNLVETIFGMSMIANIVYILVGLSALSMIVGATKKPAMPAQGGMGQM